jgi:hypothetical protein
MSDPIVIIESLEPNIVLVDGSVTNNTTDYSVAVESVEPYSLSIETSFVENIGIIEIERTSSANINILGPLTTINVGGSVSTNVTNSSNLYLWSNFR